MKIVDVMTRDVRCTRPDATLHEAADRMRSMGVGLLPVCDEDRLLGVVSEHDIVAGSVADGHDPETDHVADVMNPELLFCFEDQDVSETARIMSEKQVRGLPV